MKMKWVILVPLALILIGILVISSCSKAAAPASTTVSIPVLASTTQAPLITISTPTSTPVSTTAPTLTTTLTPTPTPTLTPTPTPTPTLHFLYPTNTPAPAPTGVIPWDQALKLTCNGQTITVTGIVYEVLGSTLSLGAPISKGFTVVLSDPTKFPADLRAAYLGKTIEATGIFYNKVGSGTGPGTVEISITVSDQSQIKVIK